MPIHHNQEIKSITCSDGEIVVGRKYQRRLLTVHTLWFYVENEER